MIHIKQGVSKYIACLMSVFTMMACSDNNCPFENMVSCNYFFYDSEGVAIKYSDEITVCTLMPGYKDVYTYRLLGSPSIVRYEHDESLIEAGYTETVTKQRKDTVLVNKLTNASSMKVPMSYFNETDTLVIKYKSISLDDTIKVTHNSYAHVDQPECGTYRYHTLKSVSATDAAIDRVEIVNSKVNFDQAENVRIYFNGVVNE